ncbi:hypothetical protein PUN28_017059 [Cardiocondyla obscurior]|uniref:Uncharacterized protein n=1 Tax=Cardiocondyla obscurior TaxID=286306 RepID=A0AAW2EPE1_9HYME
MKKLEKQCSRRRRRNRLGSRKKEIRRGEISFPSGYSQAGFFFILNPFSSQSWHRFHHHEPWLEQSFRKSNYIFFFFYVAADAEILRTRWRAELRAMPSCRYISRALYYSHCQRFAPATYLPRVPG